MMIWCGRITYEKAMELKRELNQAGFPTGESGRLQFLSVSNTAERTKELAQICDKYDVIITERPDMLGPS